MGEGYRARISVLIPDQAGNLKMLLEILDKVKANVHDIYHERSTTSVPVGYVQVILTFNLQNAEQLTTITTEIGINGLNYEVMR
jgi:threonine dehydratase